MSKSHYIDFKFKNYVLMMEIMSLYTDSEILMSIRANSDKILRLDVLIQE